MRSFLSNKTSTQKPGRHASLLWSTHLPQPLVRVLETPLLTLLLDWVFSKGAAIAEIEGPMPKPSSAFADMYPGASEPHLPFFPYKMNTLEPISPTT